MDRLKLALAVMMRWETLVTLVAFIAVWLLVRYVADPWRSEGRRASMRAFMSSRKAEAPPAAVADDDPDSLDDDDELPD
ncbi:MAG: hypothetical protein RBT62_06985 [Spirochaetia bacterium]|nr:hypothetical protein [Spirochaetia bacterium]